MILSKKHSQEWWTNQHLLAEKTKGTKEGIESREILIKALCGEKKYSEALSVMEEILSIARSYPEMSESVKTYEERMYDLKELVVNKGTMPRWKGRNYFFFVVFIVAIAILFLSPNLTGNVVENPEINTTNWVGLVLLVLSGIMAVVYIFLHR